MTSLLSGFAFRLSSTKHLYLNSFPLFISSRNETYYDVLRLPRSCTSKEIRDAFITLSKENHPDKHQNDPSMHIRFVKINEAYRTLSKPSSRQAYDMSLGSKRKLGPPYTTTTTSSKSTSSYEDEYVHVHQHDFTEPFMWNNAKNDSKKSSKDYYGIKGVKKVSNTVILWLIFAFTVVGGLIQLAVISLTASNRNRYMLEESRKNSILENMLKERAKLYGNDHQIQVLKNSLKATYNLEDEEEDKGRHKEKPDN